MYIPARTLDDLMRRVLGKLLTTRNRANPTRGGTAEIFGIVLKLSNPRARLSRTEQKQTLFSGLGEFLWYMAKTDSANFIGYYARRYLDDSEDGKTLYGAYGPRLFRMRGIDQVASVVTLLKERPASRRAVIQLFNAEDITKHHKEVPCTCTLQFLLRDRRLNLFVSMRSNDAFIGLPHDIFAFTMLQEVVARMLDVDVGIYKHAVGSLHLYDSARKGAQKYMKEGWQPIMPMEPMPVGDPAKALRQVIRAERAIRTGKNVDVKQLELHPYWADIVRLLQVFHHFKSKDTRKIAMVKRQMSTSIYTTYINVKYASAEAKAVELRPVQARLL